MTGGPDPTIPAAPSPADPSPADAPPADPPPGGRTVAESEVTFARPMTQLDANPIGNVHGGVIMHEVDVAAGTAATRHAGRVAVTAAIDELSFLRPVHIGDVLIVSARVNDVGRTSIEVGVKVEAEPWQGGPRRHTTSAYLVFVALGDDGKPVAVPPLLVRGEDERRRQAQARIRRQIRQERIARIGTYRPEPGGDENGAAPGGGAVTSGR